MTVCLSLAMAKGKGPTAQRMSCALLSGCSLAQRVSSVPDPSDCSLADLTAVLRLSHVRCWDQLHQLPQPQHPLRREH